MRFDIMSGGGKLRYVQRLAQDAERVGIGGIVFTETGRTAYLAATAAALVTDRLHLGTGVAVAFPRSPMVTAKVAWELADVSDGRFDLGLGTQVRAHIERRYSAEFAPPGPRMRDYINAVRAIFAAFQGTERLGFEGAYYKHTLLPGGWSAGPIDHPNVPISVAAVGPWMLRMAGEVADGVHVHPIHTMTYLEQSVFPAVLEGANKAGRNASEIDLHIPVFTVVGDTEEERAPLKAQAKGQIAFYGSTKNYGFIFEQLGYEGVSAQLNDLLKAGNVAGMAEVISDEMLDHFAVTATWDELSDKLVTRYDGVATSAIMYFAEAMYQRDPGAIDKWGEVARDVENRTST